MTAERRDDRTSGDSRSARALRWMASLLLASIVLGTLPGCAPLQAEPSAFSVEVDLGPPLSGEALQQRKRELRRAMRDMVHIGATLEGLRTRRGGTDYELVSYVYRYFGEHVDPLLRSSTASEDPGLAALAASVHLLKADLLVEMDERSGVRRVVAEIERRFAGRDTMLVDYPIGSQTTLREALEHVRERSRGKRPGRWAQPLPPA
ncbi:MAG: hypothetical protein V3V67_05605 [Myxococcota bacterium]